MYSSSRQTVAVHAPDPTATPTTFSVGANAIIFDGDERVLLSHRRDHDIWNLPGGAVERGELPTDAGVREVEEETGLVVEVARLVGVYANAHKDDIVFAFECKVVGGKLTATAESRDHRYYAVDAIPANTIPKQVERIHDARQRRDAPIFRRQTAQPVEEMIRELGLA